MKAHNITLTASNDLSKSMIKLEGHETSVNGGGSGSGGGGTNNHHHHHHLNMASFTNVTNTSYDQPKRTRFSFKTEHLLVIYFYLI